MYVNMCITKKLASHSCTFQRRRIAEGMVEMSLLDSQCQWTPLDPVHRLYVCVTLIIVGKYSKHACERFLWRRVGGFSGQVGPTSKSLFTSRLPCT